jgi:hypothetical protein
VQKQKKKRELFSELYLVAFSPSAILTLLLDQKVAGATDRIAVGVILASDGQSFQAEPSGIREADGPAAVPAAVRALHRPNVLDSSLNACPESKQHDYSTN